MKELPTQTTNVRRLCEEYLQEFIKNEQKTDGFNQGDGMYV